MSDGLALETPGDFEGILLAEGSDADEFLFRPAFTGDIYDVGDDRLVLLIQHPCAMRRGAELNDRLLVCEVTLNTNGVPKNWSSSHFKRMFFPRIGGRSYLAELDNIDVVSRASLEAGRRIALLSALGVNVLVQRWLHHNSRVIVPTITINAQTSGPYEEADLVGDACWELVDGGFEQGRAIYQIDHWLSEKYSDPGVSRREMLSDPQQRSAVRTALRRQTKSWLAAG